MRGVNGVRSVSVEEYVATLRVEEREVARHVLLGGFNKRGRPVGFHHAPNGVAPPGRRVDRILKRYPDGSYLARVSMWDGQRGWVPKRGLHSMFPGHWTSEDVLRAGWQAYRDRPQRHVLRWRSQVPGMRIGGFRRVDRGGPATFFPDLSR
jgi:hypothetical protein